MTESPYRFQEFDLPEELLEWRRDLIATSTKWSELNLKLDAYSGDPVTRRQIEEELKQLKERLLDLERRLT